MKRAMFVVLAIFIQNLCLAQKHTTVDYIEVGIDLIKLFKTKPKVDSKDCIYEVKFNNISKDKLSILIKNSNNDSIKSTLVIPPNSVSSLYSLDQGIYNCKIMNTENTLLKITEFIIKDCGTLKIEIK